MRTVLSPSSANIWGSPKGCRGWASMPKFKYSTKEATAGTLSHKKAAKALNDFSLELSEGDPEKIYVDDVKKTISGRVGSLEVEQEVFADRIHTLCFGTPDCYFYDSVKNVLFIWEYKHGYTPVYAYENWQLLVYACSILPGIRRANTQVVMRVIQPNAYVTDAPSPIREWKASRKTLRKYFVALKRRASISMDPEKDPGLRTGPHCKYCEARHSCPAAYEASVSLYEVSKPCKPCKPTARELSAQFSILSRAKKQIISMESALEAQISYRIYAGESIPGYHLVPGRGIRKWSGSVKDTIELGLKLGYELSDPRVLSPSKAEKLGMSKKVIADNVTKSKPGMKVSPSEESSIRVFNREE